MKTLITSLLLSLIGLSTFSAELPLTIGNKESKTVVWQGKNGPQISFPLTERASNFQISVEAETEEVFIDSLIDPSGDYVIGPVNLKNRMGLSGRLMTTLNSKIRPTYVHGKMFTVSPRFMIPLKKGNYQFRLVNPKANSSTISAATISFREIRRKNLRDENFHLNLEIIIDKQNGAEFETRVKKELIPLLKDLYSSYAIILHPILKSQDSLNQTLDSGTPIPVGLDKALAQLSHGGSNNLKLYLIALPETYSENNQERVLQGLSLCLPASFSFKNNNCALGVSFNRILRDQIPNKRIVKVMAHEIAHALGLYHLEDDFYPFGTLTDRIEDTDPSEAHNNIMHKTSDDSGDLLFTQMQVEVIKQSPLLEEVLPLF